MIHILGVALLVAAAPSAPRPYVAHATLGYRGPVAYADRATETVFYVESDGRHLSAIQFDGKILWTRDPYVEAHLERAPYRVKERRIVSIGRADQSGLPKGVDGKKMFLSIAFNSTDFGIVDAETGAFTYLGRD